MVSSGVKPVHWMGSSLRDLREFPDDVRSEAGHAVYLAQRGDKAPNAIPMVGFGGASVLETIFDDDGETFRAVYTVRFKEAIYVLHAFKKKSKKGIETPKSDMDLIRTRLRYAEKHHKENYKDNKREGASHVQGK